jgi:iron complex outermembrane receptor protein
MFIGGVMKNNRWFYVLVLAAGALFCQASFLPLHAQSSAGTARISGTVTDPIGNVLSNMAVTIRGESGNFTKTVATDEEGHYSAADLPAGSYTIELDAPGFSPVRRTGVKVTSDRSEEVSFSLKITPLKETLTVEAGTNLPVAVQLAPSQSSLEARSAQSVISQTFIQNFASPVADYSQVIVMAPGTFSVSPNGVGLGDTKTFFRGFSDGNYTMTFDGIPFNDTNDPTHHSWAFFPGQFIGSTEFDRSPGDATTVGPANFGGSINLLSRAESTDQNFRLTTSYGSFNTRLIDFEFDSGRFGGKSKKSSFLMDVHHMDSDGYQTYNFQRRLGYSGKYQYAFKPGTTLTVFAGVIDTNSNTPNTKGPTRQQIIDNGYNYLLSNDPTKPNYYGYNLYHIPTDFEYVGFNSDLGHGWSFDNKVYTYSYYNHQQYNSATKLNATSGVDKLNSYRKIGDLLPFTQTSRFGVLRTGLWYEWARSYRYQIPTNPQTWDDGTNLPNFRQRFTTITFQPYVEYQFNVTRKFAVTPGVKLSYYKQDFTQYPDGKVTHLTTTLEHAVTYKSWQPAFDMRYELKPRWSLYGQFATGNVIPPTNTFDVTGTQVSVLPKPTQTITFQAGTVFQSNRFTFDFDFYHVHFQNGYNGLPDPTSPGDTIYVATASSITKGAEFETNVFLIHGLAVYLNGTFGSARYVDTRLWVASAPQDTETVGLLYQWKNWDVGFFNKRIGKMYNDNGNTAQINQAIGIDPFHITNIFFNYTIKNEGMFRQTKFRLSVNNLTDSHNVIGVPTPATASSSNPGDLVTLLPGRSINFAVTFGFSPRHKSGS